jgi:hypothetical protein
MVEGSRCEFGLSSPSPKRQKRSVAAGTFNDGSSIKPRHSGLKAPERRLNPSEWGGPLIWRQLVEQRSAPSTRLASRGDGLDHTSYDNAVECEIVAADRELMKRVCHGPFTAPEEEMLLFAPSEHRASQPGA